ncbi:DUF3443 family protein [Paraburkholderia sp. Ac-20347]|uniref:DUF3443 family protein n=1 Tax=Paraburkholderia sp. Ac-20347 TaxID=2703892 RepID=UPI00198153F5|nr:DUF3443 family protein [Paraburkholderia sp. Ac-20347]MBN3811537.1 DUF3443 family protein [Paraburkholderia sp. Ac-20347]
MNKIILASAIALSVALAACGGGGDGAGDGAPGNAAVSNGGAPSSGGASGSGANPGGSGSGKATDTAANNPPNTGSAGSNGSGSGNAGSGSGTPSGNSGAGGSSSGGQSSGGTNSSGTSGGDISGGDTSGSGAPGGGSTDSGAPDGGASADIGNTVAVRVSSASRVRNVPLVSVTVCQPGSSGQKNCATIDNVLLDTGSFGLRLYASAIPAATLAALPIQRDDASGTNVAACGMFGSGYTWGSLRNADVKLSREIAASVPIQVIGDPVIVSSAPSSCVYNDSLNTTDALGGVNGILGVGVARNDCGAACVSSAQAGYYYADAAPATPIAMPLANQVTNPVALFPVDNNGLIVDMPAIDATGALATSGTVTFGVGTQSNNALPGTGTTILATDRWGNFSGSVAGGSTVPAFIDSGSNTLGFEDWALPQYQGFYAPVSAIQRALALSDSTGAAATASIGIGNARTLLATRYTAFSTLGSFLGQTLDLGMPFFYGQRVWYGIEGTRASANVTGPYVSFAAR